MQGINLKHDRYPVNPDQNNRIAIGVAISPTSSYKGGQFDISLLVWKKLNFFFFLLFFFFSFYVFDIEYVKAKCDFSESELLTISIRKFYHAMIFSLLLQ